MAGEESARAGRVVMVPKVAGADEPSEPQSEPVVQSEREADDALVEAVRADVRLIRKLALYERDSIYLGLRRGSDTRLGRCMD